ncbi:MAG: hypothetical protein JWO77_3393 [Ilumatobacteraceae bacterium]|nr:hypothetical protein [Ilumatobacteraceae bacterium]
MAHAKPSEQGRGWSVRALLLALVAVVLSVFLLVGAALGVQTWRAARETVHENARSISADGTDALVDNLEIASVQTASIASNPGVPPLFADPGACGFDFDLSIFPESHLDVVAPDGTVVCSSADLEAGATHASAPWLTRPAAKPATMSRSFTDDVTGLASVAFAAPVPDPDGEGTVGWVAVVVPTEGIAQPIAEVYGGPRNYQFAITDRRAERTLSMSDGLREATPSSSSDPMADAGYIHASQPVPGTSWTVSAGADPDVSLAPARSVLIRGGILAGSVLLVLLLSILVVSRKISRPLRQLTRTVGSEGPHVDTVLAEIQGPSEVTELAAEFRTANASREAYESQLSHQALHDPLTGLPNRALLAERLQAALSHAERTDGTVAVLFLDLDRFKRINDSLGHDVGDKVLVVTAERLLDAIPADATLARFGGDEFVVVTPVVDDSELDGLVPRLLAAVDQPIETSTAVVRLTTSIGVATSAPHRRPTDLIRDADTAMYVAKERGRSRAESFSDSLHAQAASRLTMASEFRAALSRDELHVVYQPKIDLLTSEIVGVEALLRWDHPALGSVPPSTFIPVAEETDAIITAGEFVLDAACRQAAEWRDQGIDLSVAVNVSGRQLSNGNLAAAALAALAASGLAPDRLFLELTETLLMSDSFRTQRTLETLHGMGIGISVDDFGTGYSSLAYLHRFPVDELKIDRAFVSDLGGPDQPAPLVAAMVAMGSALGLSTVAEGVETTEQAEQLRLLGCNLAQGYLFARPCRAEDLTPILEAASGPRTRPSPALPPL